MQRVGDGDRIFDVRRDKIAIIQEPVNKALGPLDRRLAQEIAPENPPLNPRQLPVIFFPVCGVMNTVKEHISRFDADRRQMIHYLQGDRSETRRPHLIAETGADFFAVMRSRLKYMLGKYRY